MANHLSYADHANFRFFNPCTLPKLTIQIASYLKQVSITSLLLHVTLYRCYMGSFHISLSNWGFVFAFAIPILSIIVGYLLISPYVFKSSSSTDSKRNSKVTPIVSTSLSNTGVTILCAIFVIPSFMLAGVAILVFGLATILVTVFFMEELSRRKEIVPTS